MDKLFLPRDLLDRIIAHCRVCFPNEACGILAGRGGRAEKVYEMKNAEPSPVSYLMDPGEQFLAMKEMRRDAMEMVAIFHSHPQSPAWPSQKDIRLAFYSDSVYIIVSLMHIQSPEVRAFEITEGVVKDVRIES